jgi:hypothetical protein
MGKSGKNDYSHYDYFQLKDFIPQVIQLGNKHGVFTKYWIGYKKIELPAKKTTSVQFDENGVKIGETIVEEENFEMKEFAFLEAINMEDPEDTILLEKETGDVRLSGAQAIQNVGGKTTYMKRYMYMDLFEIVENDSIEENTGKPEKVETKKASTTKPVTKTVSTKKEEVKEEPKEEKVEETKEVATDDLMTMDHKVELANYMKANGLDPREEIVEAAKELGVDVPYLTEAHFEEIKKIVDRKVGK